ncbi:uncharacterized protein LOC119675488 [Teleopsis dalmanni]|uniref:uncharacterized protein LOC119675488 n=1 Tax=Teleopsis dalmanni TaxID=139649 RepID=UPI0018CD8D2D|nr:uncharacterized protein LOC119675488 [Teleopsis dalmanni]
MKFVLLLLSALMVLAATKAEEQQEETIFERNFKRLHHEPEPPVAKSRANVETKWIVQKLDQFNEEDDRTWEMRYMSNDEFYEQGGPLFIFVGGEWAISQGYLVGGHMYDMAKEHKGYLFYTEHRYYGQSRPTKDITNENIVYLDVRQALADLAHFIRTMKATIPGMTDSKVILVGGSYSATMVTWFKKLYPDLATGSWASSAPLFAKVNFVEYKEVTGQSIRLVGGDACYKRIENGIAELEDLFARKRGAEVKAMFKICNNFDENNDLDQWNFFSEVSDIFAGLVQTHNDGNIQRACQRIMDGEDDVSGLANYLLPQLSSTGCNDFSYKSMLGVMLNSAYTNNIMRQWIYQTCNEYGWYQTSGSRNQPFGTKFPVTLYTTLCYDSYGTRFTNEYINAQVSETNNYFGGLSPEVENVYITHGQLDPWRAMGIQDEEQATVIPLYAHCKDFGSISSSDTAEMRASKEKIAALVREWVGSSATSSENIPKQAESLLQKLRNETLMPFIKMKLSLILVALGVLVCSTIGGTDETTANKIPVFLESFKKLHRGPPIVETQSRAIIETKWIEQKLDNFDESESRTWQMRYMQNDEHFETGGPMFIYVGGEWTISSSSIASGHFVDMAAEHKGMLFYTEHRFYGQSKPTGDITVDNLKYLHIKQALADLAHFIKYQRENNPDLANSKVIMAGGSYAATMVVWFKRLYPELMAGGWASSAPLLAKVDFLEYHEVVGRALIELGSQQCYDRVQNGVAEIESMFANKRSAEVKALFKLCNNFDEQNDLDLWSFFSVISNLFASIVQYQSGNDIPITCNYLATFEDDVTALAGLVLWAYGASSCLDVTYKSSLSYLMDSTYVYGASRPWYYQTCNEYGWYQTSRSRNQPFGTKFPVTLYTTLCEDVFGSKYTNENINANAAQTNLDFGGMSPEVENVYMTHGALDPWNPMGHGAEEGATVIAQASHCADFSSISSSDSSEMRASKQLLAELVRQWLADDETDIKPKNITKDKVRKYMRQLV